MSGCSCQQRRCLLCETFLSSARLAPQQVCEVRGLIAREVFRPREVLFSQGTPVDELFILKYGYVKLSAGLSDGRAQGLQLGVPWTLIGIEALQTDTYPCTAEAMTDVQVCSIRRDELLRVLHHDAGAAWRLIELLNQALRGSVNQVVNLGVMDATERVASFLVSVAPTDAAPEEEVPLYLTRGDMAEILGLTVETISRVLTRLKRSKVIDAPNMARHFRILDRPRLVALGEGEAAAEGYVAVA